MMIDINPENFQKEVIEKSSDIPVVVDFWADWCMPCRMLIPLLEKISKEFDGKFILAKVNVDENSKTASEYGIMSIPTVKLIKEGKVVDEFNGGKAEPFIIQWLENNGITQ